MAKNREKTEDKAAEPMPQAAPIAASPVPVSFLPDSPTESAPVASTSAEVSDDTTADARTITTTVTITGKATVSVPESHLGSIEVEFPIDAANPDAAAIDAAKTLLGVWHLPTAPTVVHHV